MREELESLLGQYTTVFNDESDIPFRRNEVKQLIVNFLEVKRINSIIFDYKVEDRTMFNDDNGLYFQIIYQPTRIPDFMVMDITLWNQEVTISNFEKNVVGSRNIKKLEL